MPTCRHFAKAANPNCGNLTSVWKTEKQGDVLQEESKQTSCSRLSTTESSSQNWDFGLSCFITTEPTNFLQKHACPLT